MSPKVDFSEFADRAASPKSNSLTSWRPAAILMAALICLSSLASQLAAQVEQLAFLKGEPASFDRALRSVAMDDDTIVVGGTFANIVYVFVRNGDLWEQQATLSHPLGRTFVRFGFSVAIQGDTIIVGAPNDFIDEGDFGTSESGSVHIYQRNGTTWSHQTTLESRTSGAHFGQSIAIDGDTLVVAATDERTDLDRRRGRLHTYDRNGTEWVLADVLPGFYTDESISPFTSIAFSGDTLVAGAIEDQSLTTEINGEFDRFDAFGVGAAWVLRRSGASWTREAYLKAPNAHESGGFGYSVSIDGDTLVVGAEFERGLATGVDGDINNLGDSPNGNGAAFVFVRSGSDWSQQAYLKSQKPANGAPYFEDHFGGSVSIVGDTILVGASRENSKLRGIDGAVEREGLGVSGARSGAAYLYRRSGGSWKQVSFIKSALALDGDQFGKAVALSGEFAAVVADFESSSSVENHGDEGLQGSGAIYAFSIGPEINSWELDGNASASFFDETQWSRSEVPEFNESYILPDKTSKLLFDKPYANVRLQSLSGGAHTYDLGTQLYSLKETEVSSGSIVLVDGSGTFETERLVLGNSATGELKALNGTIQILDTAIIGDNPGLTGRLSATGSNSKLLFKGDGPVVSLGLSSGGGQVLVENGATVDWGKVLVLTGASEASFLEFGGTGTKSTGGSFLLSGTSELLVRDGARFELGTGPNDSLELNAATARFESNSTGVMRLLDVRNDAGAIFNGSASFEATSVQARDGGQLRIGDGASLTTETLNFQRAAATVEANGTLRVTKSFIEAAPPDSKAQLFVSGTNALFEYSGTESFFLGLQGGSLLEIEDGGSARFPNSELEITGIANQEAKATVSGDAASLSAKNLKISFGGELLETNNASVTIANFTNLSESTWRLEQASSLSAHLITLSQSSLLEMIHSCTGSASFISANSSSVAVLENSILMLTTIAGMDLRNSMVFIGDGSKIVSPLLTVDQDSFVFGSGRLDVDKVISSGTLIPGASPGTLTFTGDLQQIGGRIVLEVEGDQATLQDHIIVQGNLELRDCTIELLFQKGYAPKADQDFTFIVAEGGTVSASNLTVQVNGLEPGWNFTPQLGTTSGEGLRIKSLNDGVALPTVTIQTSDGLQIRNFEIAPNTAGKQTISGHVYGSIPGTRVIVEYANDLTADTKWLPITSLYLNSESTAAFYKKFPESPTAIFLRARIED